MNLFEAILLGIIQGITEFLPISSTGHLTIAGNLMSLISNENPERWTSFIAVIQLGTLAAILIYFYKDILHILIEFFRDNLVSRKPFKSQSENSKLGWLILIGTIPIVILGFSFKEIIEGALTKNLYVIAVSLIVLAVILAAAEKLGRFKKNMEEITVFDSIMIGIAQSVSLIPGSSRSGTTITGGLFMGLKRETAARFSFLLSIPAIFGSGLLQLNESLEYIDPQLAINLIVSTLFSAISGYLAIDFLLKYLKKHSTFLFVYYRIGLGILIIILISFNIINS
ncbi:MAG: undecaprenyl-diphosphatase UppP [Ignavibacteriales bacterium]|nr:MAG: undecaprenyl-diphosphatase UppP [Ignavibacteriales bacterium]